MCLSCISRKRLAAEAARRWHPFYLDYKVIKKAIQDDVAALGGFICTWLCLLSALAMSSPTHASDIAVLLTAPHAICRCEWRKL